TFETLGLLKPKVNVVGLIPATENLPSGHAVKPGDVVKSHFGKSIEIINTDAEGRLILCDALSYVRRFKPAAVIDIATLTGAVVVALGQVAIGAMGNDEALLAEVREAGERDHQDRKSTRLNSSHVSISYAVFCLKKKRQHCIRQARYYEH